MLGAATYRPRTEKHIPAGNAGFPSLGGMTHPSAAATRAHSVVQAVVVGLALSCVLALAVVLVRAPGLVADDDGRWADGRLPDHVTAFDTRYPGVTRLTPDLLRALRDASTAAGGHGIEIDVTSGWRSPTYQDQLLQQAVSTYGSADVAARWVATAATSPHVHGDAVDVGPADARAWLALHGAPYGLCRVYDNEPWHFELRPSASTEGCPPTYPDPTHDPRMQP